MNLEKLVQPLVADTAKFLKDIKAAENQVDRSSKNMSTSLTNMSNLAGKALTGLVVGGIGALTTAIGVSINRSLEWAGTLDTLSDHLGTTSDESAGLALALRTVGTDSGTFTSAMDSMTRGLLNAKGELGPTGQAITNLGISVRDANGNIKPATELFQEIADKMAKAPPGLDATSKLMDIFGKNGAEMGDLLGAAADGGLAKFNEQAKNLGLALNPEQVQQAIDFKAKLEELKATFDGLSVQLGIIFLPVLTDLLTKFAAWLQLPETQQGFKDFVNWIRTEGIPAFEKLVNDVFPVLIENLPLIAAGIGTLVGVLGAVKIVGIVTSISASLGPLMIALPKLFQILGLIFQLVTSGGPVMLGLGMAFRAVAFTVFGASAEFVIMAAPVLALIGAIALLTYVVIRFGAQAWETVKMISQLIVIELGLGVKHTIDNVGAAWNWLTTAFQNGANWISTAINNVMGWIDRLSHSLSALTLPSWLRPGSPPPLYFALKDIQGAMEDLNSSALPKFSANLNMGNSTFGTGNEDVVAAIKGIPQTTFDYKRNALSIRDAMLTSGATG